MGTTGTTDGSKSVDEFAVSQQQQNMMILNMREFKDDQNIEELVKEVATVTNRGMDKANEWLQRLHAQDIMTVGDLRDLHDEDWASLGLTVFASRALRNALHGKQGRNISPKGVSRSVVTTPPTGNTLTMAGQAEFAENIGIGISRMQSPPVDSHQQQQPPPPSSL